MAKISHVPCGACGADQPQSVGIPRVSEDAKVVTPGWEAMRVAWCRRCGFYYTDPMPFWDGEDLQKLYDAEYFLHKSAWWHYVRTEVDPRLRLDAIAREIEDKGWCTVPRLLDIGCGQGYVLEHALQRGWEVWGLEPSKVWAHKTAARLGVKVWTHRLEDADLPASFLDVVFADSVIEHLADPMTIMKLAWRVLKPSGIAYFVTPNADALVNHFRGLLFRLVGSRRSPYIEPLTSPYHVVGFTPNSLSILSERAGFEVRRLWVGYGQEEWRKEKKWTLSKFKSLALWPALLVGELMGRGTTIEVLLIRR